jgi:hypothetical protein
MYLFLWKLKIIKSNIYSIQWNTCIESAPIISPLNLRANSIDNFVFPDPVAPNITTNGNLWLISNNKKILLRRRHNYLTWILSTENYICVTLNLKNIYHEVRVRSAKWPSIFLDNENGITTRQRTKKRLLITVKKILFSRQIT